MKAPPGIEFGRSELLLGAQKLPNDLFVSRAKCMSSRDQQAAMSMACSALTAGP